eukprot:m.3618 g.3618  ORF g.3618 m.3618 type:complete len:89 (-) comp1510_c0_seq2:1014-1280(-)
MASRTVNVLATLPDNTPKRDAASFEDLACASVQAFLQVAGSTSASSRANVIVALAKALIRRGSFAAAARWLDDARTLLEVRVCRAVPN